MSTTTINRLRELEAKATPGPWESVHGTHSVLAGELADHYEEAATGFIPQLETYGDGGNGYMSAEQADFVAAARNALPALLDVAEAAAKIARVVGDGNTGAGRLITAGECKELWDALKRLEASNG